MHKFNGEKYLPRTENKLSLPALTHEQYSYMSAMFLLKANFCFSVMDSADTGKYINIYTIITSIIVCFLPTWLD